MGVFFEQNGGRDRADNLRKIKNFRKPAST
jgi:hypothetical protein